MTPCAFMRAIRCHGLATHSGDHVVYVVCGELEHFLGQLGLAHQQCEFQGSSSR